MITLETPYGPVPSGEKSAGQINIALVNNMPDAALCQTERQFCGLLGSAGIPVHLRRYTLPGIRRGKAAAALIRESYFPFEQLWATFPDALIVTGCEPLSADLTCEPYWPELTELLRWGQRHTVSTLSSCLAAHATVLAFDGIERQPLPAKRSGVFIQRVARDHPLCAGLPSEIAVPHSRVNDVSTMALVSCGYQPLAASEEVGWSVVAKDQADHLFLLMQGHPEYDAETLILEYRRDIRRYLDGVRSTYPPAPQGYLTSEIENELEAFKRIATSGDRAPELMAKFPMTTARRSLTRPWRRAAENLYRNWLTEVRRRAQEREIAYV